MGNFRENTYVLMMGYRQELAKALEKYKVKYSIVTNKPLKKRPKHVDQIILSEFNEEVVSEIAELKIKPTHVIAGVEAAVYPASRIRKHFMARLSEDTLVRRCSNKAEMKYYLWQKQIPMTSFVLSKPNLSSDEIIENLSLPVVVKKILGSGGRDLVLCKNKDALEKHLGKDLIYESFIDAAEGSVESFVNKGQILFTNVTEYYVKGHCNVVPAGYSQEEIEKILELNQMVLKKLRVSWGLTHMEFYRHKKGLLFGEIAIRPPGGYIMKLIEEAYGFNPWEALLHIELDQEFEFPRVHNKYAACWIYHPGPGKVLPIKELENLSTLLVKKLKAKEGQDVFQRFSVGEDLGYILFSSRELSNIKRDLDREDVRNLILTE